MFSWYLCSYIQEKTQQVSDSPEILSRPIPSLPEDIATPEKAEVSEKEISASEPPISRLSISKQQL